MRSPPSTTALPRAPPTISAAPTVVNYDPPYNSTVGTNVIPKMVFNKPLNPITVNNSTFRMYLIDTGQFIPLTVTLSTSGLEVTMTPQIPLLPNTYYHFQACCGFQDEDGNAGSTDQRLLLHRRWHGYDRAHGHRQPADRRHRHSAERPGVAFPSAPIDSTSWSSELDPAAQRRYACGGNREP